MVMKNWRLIFYAVTLVLVFFVYSGILVEGKINLVPDNYNYFKDLALALQSGKVDIAYPAETQAHDLVQYNNKYFLYWPPVPAVVYIPLTMMFGRNTPDAFITAMFGMVNVLLFIILLELFVKKYNIGLGFTGITALALFWAFGTVHFYMSRVGSVWYTSQVLAQTFLLLSIIFVLKSKSVPNILCSGIFYSLAVYTRNDLVFTIFFIAAIYFTHTRDAGNGKYSLSKIAVFLVPFVLLSLTNLAYNYSRFGNVFDNGIKYHRMDSHFTEDYANHGYLSAHYLLRNFYTEVVHAPYFKKEFPFFKFDAEGYGFLWVSPLLILSVINCGYYKNAVIKNLLRKPGVKSNCSYGDTVVMTGALAAGITVAGIIMMVMGTGWVQFGSRYSLDYQLVMVLFGLFILKDVSIRKLVVPSALLIAGSIFMNYHGMKYYLNQ
ncbi:MAG: hypothetical protein WC955_10305 [Elusimicrobiota bacterium]